MGEWLLSGAFRGFLVVHGTTMYLVPPRAATPTCFHAGARADDRPVSTVPLRLSVFGGWIFKVCECYGVRDEFERLVAPRARP